jgi:hypothetical protein
VPVVGTKSAVETLESRWSAAERTAKPVRLSGVGGQMALTEPTPVAVAAAAAAAAMLGCDRARWRWQRIFIQH